MLWSRSSVGSAQVIGTLRYGYYGLRTTNYFWTWESKPRVEWADYAKRLRKLDWCFMLRSWQRRLRPRLDLKKKMSFEDVRNTLLTAYTDGFLDDEEFSILYDYFQPVNPPISRLEFWSILFGCVRLLRVWSSLQGGQGWYSDFIERIADSGEFEALTGNSLQWLRRTLFTAKTISIPMPLFRFNFNFWTSGDRAVHDG